MSLGIDKDRTKFFTVVGAPYLAEKHTEDGSHLPQSSSGLLPPEAGIATIWLIAYAAIFAVTLFAHGGITEAFARAAAYLR